MAAGKAARTDAGSGAPANGATRMESDDAGTAEVNSSSSAAVPATQWNALERIVGLTKDRNNKVQPISVAEK